MLPLGGQDMGQLEQKIAKQEMERVISSGERLTIDTIAEFVQHMRKVMTEATAVVIEFEQNIDIDITALQVFCSACKTAAAEGKQITHRGPIPQKLVDLIGTAGLEHHEHCTKNNMSCFLQFGGDSQWQS
jgi:anti-anti-sigma regulatory factor